MVRSRVSSGTLWTTLVGSNDFVRRVTAEVEPSGGTRNGKVNRPHVHPVQYADYFAVVEIHLHPAELLKKFVAFHNENRDLSV